MRRIRFYDTNLSWNFVFVVFGVVVITHWWYDRAMRMRRWMPLELAFVRRNDPEITDAGRCSACRAEIDIELIEHYDYQTDRSGVQPGTQHGPTVYWSEGTIACPGCGVRLPYSESSD